MAANSTRKGDGTQAESTEEEEDTAGEVVNGLASVSQSPYITPPSNFSGFAQRTEKPVTVSFLASHTPSPWFQDDPSYSPRLRQFRSVIIQSAAWFLLKIIKEAFFPSWSLYSENAEFFAVLFIFLALHIANVSHNSSNLVATKLYNANTYIAIGLWMMSWILFGLVIHEMIVCADLSKEDFQVLLDCYKLEPQTLGQGNLACALGADIKTRATGTCPSLEFKSESKGNAWLFFQFVVIVFHIAFIFLNIMDSIKITAVLCEINYEEAKEQLEKKQVIFETISQRETGKKAQQTRFASHASAHGLRARF